MADSSDSELADAGRLCLADGALPACSKVTQPLAQKDGAEPTNYTEALRVFTAASKMLGGSDGLDRASSTPCMPRRRTAG